MFNKRKEHIFSIRLNKGKLDSILKKLIKIKDMVNICSYNNFLSYKDVKNNHLNNLEDNYYFSLKRLFRQYQI
jgi:hypothetical protein